MRAKWFSGRPRRRVNDSGSSSSYTVGSDSGVDSDASDSPSSARGKRGRLVASRRVHQTACATVAKSTPAAEAAVPPLNSASAAPSQFELFKAQMDLQRCIVEWLEQPTNYETIVWNPRRGFSEPEKGVAKRAAFHRLADYVVTRTNVGWKLLAVRTHLANTLTAYRQANQAGIVFSTADFARGITDATQKRNHTCCFYDRLNALAMTGKPLAADSTTTAQGASSTSGSGSGSIEEDAPSAQVSLQPKSTSQAAVTATAAAKTSAARQASVPARAPASASSSAPAPVDSSAAWFGAISAQLASAPAPMSAISVDAARGTLPPLTLDPTWQSDGTLPLPSPVSDVPRAKRIKRRRVSNASSSESDSAFGADRDVPVVAAAARQSDADDSKHLSSTLVASSAAFAGHPLAFAAEAQPASSASSVATSMSNTSTVRTDTHNRDCVKLKKLDVAMKRMDVENQKLVLLQQQLQLQTRELELKEKELAAQEAVKKRSMRAELTTKLIAAGTPLSDIKEYLALLDG